MCRSVDIGKWMKAHILQSPPALRSTRRPGSTRINGDIDKIIDRLTK